MLDLQNPEIKVDEIMTRIQEKVRLARLRPFPEVGTGGSALPDSSLLFGQLLAELRETAQVGTRLPPMSRMHGLKRKLAEPVAKAFLRIAQLITREQRAFNQGALGALQALKTLGERLEQDSARNAKRVEELAANMTQRLDELETRLETKWETKLETKLQANLSETKTQIETGRRELGQKIDPLRAAISLQEQRLTLLLEEARKRLPEPFDGEQLRRFADEVPRLRDAGYLAFEDAFRGSPAEIRERVSIYLPKLREAQAGTDPAPILDLGCGRGELLEVLRDHGLKASGVDSNVAAIEKCRALDLEVMAGDAF